MKFGPPTCSALCRIPSRESLRQDTPVGTGRLQSHPINQSRFAPVGDSIASRSFTWRKVTKYEVADEPGDLVVVIGRVVAIAASRVVLSLGTMVGLVTVFGVSARTAILQLAHYEHLVDAESLSWNLQTALRGANERLIPILMTAAVTALGLAPLAVGFHQPGQEIEGPMALTVLGGLATSTLLNLLALPAMAYRFGPAVRENAE